MSLSVAAAVTRAPVIPLISELNMAQVRQVYIVHTVNVGTAAAPVYEKRKMQVPYADKADVELILRTIEEFHDVASAGRLNLSTGPKKFEKFRECLGGTVRDQWDVVKVLQVTETNDTFKIAIADFIGKFLRDSDLMKQKLYMDTTPKPYRLSVKELAARYQFLNNLMKWFPASGGDKPYDETSIKYLLHTAMLQDWKDNFGRSNLTYQSSWEDIVNYFSEQEQIHNRARNSVNSSRGGRGRGRFQGYQGRGHYGRGHGYHRGRGGGRYYNDTTSGGHSYYAGSPGYHGRYQDYTTQTNSSNASNNYTTPPAQYRRLNAPPTRVSTGPMDSTSSSPGRYVNYRGRFSGRGRFQQLPVHQHVQHVHYADDAVYYVDPGEVYQHRSTNNVQDNYLAADNDQQVDYQEPIDNHDAYFHDYGNEHYYNEGQW